MAFKLRRYLEELFDDDRTEPPIFNPAIDEPFVFPPHVRFSGSVVADGDMILNDRYEGRVEATRVYLSKTAEFHGEIVAKHVEIAGHFDGNVVAEKIVLRPSAVVEGELAFLDLSIDVGAWFEGSTRREVNHKRLAERAVTTDTGTGTPRDTGVLPLEAGQLVI